jgi:hypothetical protein
VAWLVLTAATNQHSAFVPVVIGPSIGTASDGTLVTNYVTQAGRVVVVGQDPLLEAGMDTNGQAQLTIYSLPGSTNLLLSTTNLVAWVIKQQVISTNLTQLVQPFFPTNHAEFFHAVRQGVPFALTVSHLVAPGANVLRLYWPAEFVGGIVQVAASPQGAWAPLTNTPALISTGWYTDIPIQNTGHFFRVRLP